MEQQLTEERQKIQDELYRITEATNPDGTVNVEITRWQKKGDKVHVYFNDAMLVEHVETMDWPTRDDTTFKFVRLCHVCDLSFSAALQLEGSSVKAHEGEWTLIAPKKHSYSKQFAAGLRSIQYRELVTSALAFIMGGFGVVLMLAVGLFGLFGWIYGLATMGGFVPALPVGPVVFTLLWGFMFFVTIVILEEA